MYRKFKINNSSGFTLIEIIASIAILGMVIVAFLPIFPQIMSWNNMTDDQLKASNLLDQAVYDLKTNSSTIIAKHDISPNICHSMSEPLNLKEEYLYQDQYYPVITVCEEENLGLYRTHLQIYSEQNPEKMLSGTYIYLNGDTDG